jgi:MYXO-CTERM domain-containing protein
MNMTRSIVVAIAATISAASHADFVGFDGEASINGEGNNVVKVYALFDSADNVLLNIFNSDIVDISDPAVAGDFIHNDVQIAAGGTWLPNASLDIPNFSNSDNDSYVTIGYGVGTSAATNATALDPNFLDVTGGIGGTVPSNAGWYNSNPSNDISGERILVGQFVFSSDLANFLFDGNVGFKTDSNTSEVLFGSGSWSIPAPGALALLGLGGLVARRRRG